MIRPLIYSWENVKPRAKAFVPVKVPKAHGGGFVYAVIDATDAHLVDDRNWFAKVRAHTIYAHDRAGEPLHLRLFPMADEVDHLDHNGLNCRRSNLRPLTGAKTRTLQNANTRAHKDGAIGLKGVRALKGKYQARITVRGRRRPLGCYRTAEEAARAYDRAAQKHFPGVAFLNFPET